MMIIQDWIPKYWYQSAPKKILLRVDGGSIRGLSFGHLFRAKAFAHYVRQEFGTEIIWLTRNYLEGVQFLKKAGFNPHVLELQMQHDEECARLQTLAQQDHVDCVYLDIPYLHDYSKICGELRKQNIETVWVDDTRFTHPQVDYYLNSSILADQNLKTRHNETTYLLGPDTFIWQKPELSQPESKSRLTQQEVIVTFGGSDPSGLTPRVLDAILELPEPELNFKIIVGPGNREGASLLQKANQSRNIDIIQNPTDLYSLLANASFVICAGGRTLYEAYLLNCKIIAIASIEHEIPVVESFLQHRYILGGLAQWNHQNFMALMSTALE